jgi:hypothetical protein
MGAVSTSDKNNFQLDLRFTDRPNPLVRPLAIAAAAVMIIVIIASMTTNLAARVLPMSDEYLQVLVPQAPDGKEPLSLQALDQTMTDTALSITGTVGNRTEFPVSSVVAVLDAQDINNAKQTVSVPLNPPIIPSQGTSTFTINLTFAAAPMAYSLNFRIADGPLVPHHDDRKVGSVPGAK